MPFRALAATLVVVTALLQPGLSNAQSADPEALAAAQKLMDISMTSEVQDSMVAQGWPAIEASIRKSAPTLGDDQLAELKSEFAAVVARETKLLLADAPALYVKYFSAQELKDILAFYETTSGKKTLSVMPALMGEVMQKTMARMPAMMESIKQSFGRVLRDKGVKL